MTLLRVAPVTLHRPVSLVGGEAVSQPIHGPPDQGLPTWLTALSGIGRNSHQPILASVCRQPFLPWASRWCDEPMHHDREVGV